jgi:hypothetical protein
MLIPTFSIPEVIVEATRGKTSELSASSQRVSSIPGQSLTEPVKYVEKPIQGDLTNLIESIGPILKGQAVKQSYHNLSAACHRLVLPPHNSGEELYSRIERDVETSLLELSKGWQRLIMAREPNFLGRFIEDWRAWEKRVVSDVDPPLVISDQ